jgi:hypothetical protein
VQTGSIVPETEAIPEGKALLALGPRYFMTEASVTNTAIALAMKIPS